MPKRSNSSGGLYLRADQLEEAQQALEHSLELDPTDPFAHLYLGNCFLARTMYAEALARFQRAVELLPDEAVAYWCQGDVYRAQGRYNLADDAYATAVRVAPTDPRAREKLAAWNECRNGTSEKTPDMIWQAYSNDRAATAVALAARRRIPSRRHPGHL